MSRIVYEIVLEAKLEEVRELMPRKAVFFPRPSLGSLVYPEDSGKPSVCSIGVVEFRKDVVELQFTICGREEEFRWQYEYNDYIKKNLRNLLNRVEKLSEEERVLGVAAWVSEKISVDRENLAHVKIDASPKAVFEGTASGDDGTLAEAYLFYASLVGVDTSYYLCPKDPVAWDEETPFFWNVVKVRGELYYIDVMSVGEDRGLMTKEQGKDWEEYEVSFPAWNTFLPFTSKRLK